MTKVVARGTPEKYPFFGNVTITVIGDEINIEDIDIQCETSGFEDTVSELLNKDMQQGPHYPLCAEPNTMRCIFFILLEWFGEDELAWITEPEHVKIVEGEIEPMESLPNVVY